jgi:hypothetical protein
MAASTVTGRGRGSADGHQKGSEHQTLGVTHLVGPRVVAAGSVALSGTTAVKIPGPDGASTAASDYIGVATDQTGANAVKVALTTVTNGDSSTDLIITLNGTGTDTISWAVIKKGV